MGSGDELNLEGLLFRIICALVDHQDEVHITITTTEAGTTFKVTVALADVGKVIGKNGRTAKALRVLLSAMGIAAKKQYLLNIITGPSGKA
jgi:predicted RNA-binding protein YlqC (UPF0109 family)